MSTHPEDPEGSRTTAQRRYRAGFTLVELLVVISIIALLIAILLPSLRKARDQAKRVKCMANLHAMHIALVCYSDDNRQELPSYYTMGQWGFRVQPGTILKYKPTDGGFPEYHGVQAVLHNGYGPPPLTPNGLPDYSRLFHDKPAYLPGDSDVWICPANIGPKGHEDDWKTFGNTYWYRTKSTEVNDDPDDEEEFVESLAYNIDSLNQGRNENRETLLKDNYFLKPAPSGMGRPDRASDFAYDRLTEWRAPHRIGSAKDSESPGYNQYSMYDYSDGTVSMKRWSP